MADKKNISLLIYW